MPENNRNRPNRKRKQRKRRPFVLTALIRLFQTIGTLILVGVLTGSIVCCYAAIYVKTVVMPDAQLDMSAYTMDENTVIYYYDDSGRPVELATLSGAENREWVEYENIPQDLIDAFVAIEDKRFWRHDGVDWYRTAAAVVNMFLSMQNTFGGSTITQQLVKNVTDYDDGTVTRKITEIFTALELENSYDKKDILEWYLNEIFLGNGCYGVQSASRLYFGKDVSELTLAECASLAGITNNPSLYSPYGDMETPRHQCKNPICLVWTLSSVEVCEYCGGTEFGPVEIWDNRRWNKARQQTILKAMADEENFAEDGAEGAFITRGEYLAALDEVLVFSVDRTDEEELQEETVEKTVTTAVNPWYVDAVISEVISDLVKKFGWSARYATEMVYSGGLSIYVPYDPDVQAAVDEIYTNPDNLNYVSMTGQKMSSAITVVDNATGYVVAMAGDVGEKTINRGWNNALTTRPPGSSIKPLTVYAPALEMGLITPASISDDNPKLLNESAWPVNAPLGWDGLVTIQRAVIVSKNTIAVNVLEMVTPEVAYEYATEKFGLTTLVKGRELSNGQVQTDIAIAPMAMGGLTDGVSTIELAAAYATFPRNGAYTEATTYLLIEDVNGQTLVNNQPKTKFVIKESTAYYMNAMLTEAVKTGTGWRAKISGQTVAGKTGTTSNAYDLWFAGYTPYYTAAVWSGYPINEDMGEIPNPSVILWQKVMAILHADLEGVGFYEPDGLRQVTICSDCGKLATDLCTKDVRGNRTQTFTLLKADRPTQECTCHQAVTICTESPILDEEGNKTGAYYLADEHFCPESCRKEVIMVDYSRVIATEEVVVKDYYALLSIYDGLSDPFCPLHMPAEPDPAEDPLLPDVPGEGDGTDPGLTEDPNDPYVPGTDVSVEPERIPSGNRPEIE